MIQELSNDEIVKEMTNGVRDVLFPEFAKLLEAFNTYESMGHQNNPLYTDQTIQLWVNRFMKDETDRLKQITENSDDESIKVEIARLSYMSIVTTLYDQMMNIFKMKIAEKLEDVDDVENA